MSTTLRTLLFALLFALIMQLQLNLDTDKTASRQLKNSLELAVHDAGLAINPAALSEGKIIFDKEKSLENLKNSLNNNLKLKSSQGYVYTPTANSFFQKELYLVHLEFIDDSISRTYPFVYYNDNYQVFENVEGPCVIAIVTTESPRWFKGDLAIIRQAAVYEYKNK